LLELGTRYGVAPSTAHRAIAELSTCGLVTVSRGRRATVVWGAGLVSGAARGRDRRRAGGGWCGAV